MIRKVVDTNAIDSDDLRDFLSKSMHHVAVLTEWPLIEALHGNDPVGSFQRRFSILEDYNSQFLLAKEAPDMARQRGRLAGLSTRMLDADGSQKIQGLVDGLSRLRRGEIAAAEQIYDKRNVSEKYLDGLLNAGGGFTHWYSVFESEYSPAELKVIRKGGTQGSILTKATKAIRDLTGFFLADRSGVVRWPRPIELPNTFQYRLALILQLHFFDWIEAGSPQSRSDEKYRNDMIDALLAVTATYFEGLITGDRKLRRIFDKSVWYLDNYSKPLARMVEDQRLRENR